jgi:predicted NBD/HSP70 family sugar kinase
MSIEYKVKPILDPDFVPAIMWNNEYKKQVTRNGGISLLIGLTRKDGSVFRYDIQILDPAKKESAKTIKYIERIIKFLLWQKGGSTILFNNKIIVDKIKYIYNPNSNRAFDYKLIGEKIYSSGIEIQYCPESEFPSEIDISSSLGRNLNGYRIGFDLGGSDRKCAALINGKVVFSEEVEWDPYFKKDHNYHYEGITKSLRSAAAHLPRVDAIGGSAAGVYVNNEVRVASLFRGIDEINFEKHVKKLFLKIKKEWGNIPFDIVNDGDVSALAGSIFYNDTSLLGMAMGTSFAVGYVNPEGKITSWLNELAFAPVDYRKNGPIEEWSGDEGAAAQYFSQQAVARLVPIAGIKLPKDMPFPEQLKAVQKLMNNNDKRAKKIFETIGVYFGYTIAHYADFFKINSLLIMGRVTSGKGGEIILNKAREVLDIEFPKLSKTIKFRIPDETKKRHGQAIAAASLPKIK